MAEATAMGIDPLAPEEMTPTLRQAAEAVGADWKASEVDQWESLLGMWAHAPEHAERFLPFYAHVEENRLGPKLTELVRFAIAGQNQCPVCLSADVPAAAAQEGLTERQRASVTDLDEGGYTPREHAAIRFALDFAGDHHAIDAAQWQQLHEVFDPEEVAELAFLCMAYLGTGRFVAAVGLINASCARPQAPAASA